MKRTSKLFEMSFGAGLIFLLALGLVAQVGAASSDGTVASEQKISSTAGGFSSGLSAGDAFGGRIASIGDLDGDGVPDLAVGALNDGPTGGGCGGSGAVYILLLNADGTVKSEQKISNGAGNFGSPLDPGDCFGSVANIGDLDGLGGTDLIVGAFLDDDGGFDKGAAYILFMNTNGTVEAVQKISDTAGGFGGFLSTQDIFGIAVAGLGDLDGDGNPDVAVGAGTAAPGDNIGAIYILFLNPDGTVQAAKTKRISGASPSAGFGRSLANIGDLDGDGVPDLAVGQALDSDGGTNRGASVILFLNPDGTVKDQQKISDTQGGFIGMLADDDQFGFSVAALGDLDGDAVSDLGVGAALDDDGGFNRGAVWILFLNTDGTVKSEQKISNMQGNFGGGLVDSNIFGSGIAKIGDLNGDGVPDLAVGAQADDDGAVDAGAVWILFLNKLDGAPEPPRPDGVPDLVGTITKVTLKEKADGNKLKVKLTISNIGTETADGPFFVQLWLSEDDRLSVDDEALDFLTIKKIKAGKSKKKKFKLRGLGAITGKFVIVSLDGGGAVEESNERNNFADQLIPSVLKEDDIPDGSNGDKDKDQGQDKASLTASGTYTFDPATGMLTFNTTTSDFECEGLQVGTEEQTVLVASTTLTLLEESAEVDDTTFTRDSGTSGDIVGTWAFIDAEGGTWTLILEADGSFSLVAQIVEDCEVETEEGEDRDAENGAASAACEPFTIPPGMITVDGNVDDWAGIDALVTDPQGDDSPAHTGDDIKALYAADDGDNLYLRMDLWENANTSFRNGFPPTDGRYVFIIENNVTPRGLGFGVAFDAIEANSQWSLGANGSNGVDTPEELQGPDFVGVSGGVIELKVPLSIIGNPTNYSSIKALVENCCATDPILELDMAGCRK